MVLEKFVEALYEKKAEVENQLAELNRELSEKLAKRDGLEQDLRMIKTLISRNIKVTGFAPTATITPAKSPRYNSPEIPVVNVHRPLSAGLATEVYKILKDHSDPLTIREILQELEIRELHGTEGGLRKCFQRNPDYFERVGRKHWKLKKQNERPKTKEK